MSALSCRRGLFLIALWLALLAGSFLIDSAVAGWVKREKPIDKQQYVAKQLILIARLPGKFPFTLGVAAVLFYLNPGRRWAAALAPIISGICGGILYSLIKWAAGRHRPVTGIEPFAFHPFSQGLHGLLHAESNLCFPSGDAVLAFATAQCLAMLHPRGRWAFYGWAVIVAAERVLENAHYVSDVIAGAGIGVLLGFFVTLAVARFAHRRASVQ